MNPFPPDSPSLRDDLFDNDSDRTPSQPAQPQDEGTRLDSLLSPEEPLEETPKTEPEITGPMDDSSRLDDLIPAPEPMNGEPLEEAPPHVKESESSSRLDDFFESDNLFEGAEEKSKGDEETEPPAFDPFLDPSARNDLLGEQSPVEDIKSEWQYLTEPPTDESLSGRTPPGTNLRTIWGSCPLWPMTAAPESIVLLKDQMMDGICAIHCPLMRNPLRMRLMHGIY